MNGWSIGPSRQRVRAGRSRPPTVDVVVASEQWRRRPEIRRLLRRAITVAAKATSASGELAIVLSDDPSIRRLNRDWRHEDSPTNVLAFGSAPSVPLTRP